MSADISNRTLVLSVVAVDLVGYSKKSVAEQMSLKDRFNQVLLEAISDISIADRIILDTGDGVAMGFLGDPEDALFVAMFMHDALNRNVGSADDKISDGAIRIGINLGPVKLATGVGGHPNIIGDGINVAERIMTFAEPGQLTASRPFFEVMSRMSDHYATLFQYSGVHVDKQVRSHDVYLVGKSGAAFRHARQGVAERATQRAGQSNAPAVPAFAPIVSRPPSPPASGAKATAVKAGPPKPESVAPASKAPVPRSTSTPMKSAAAVAAAPAIFRGERNRALIDFLEDRNKVAISATALVVVAVILAALLVYRKMAMLVPESSAPAVVVLNPAPAGPEGSAAGVVPSPTPPTEATPGPRSPDNSIAPKTDAKSPPVASSVTTPPAVTGAAKPAASSIPDKGIERQPTPRVVADPTVPAAARDLAKDAKSDKTERGERQDKPVARDETRPEPRKPVPARTTPDREKTPPVNASPIVPTYQSPVEAPRPEVVAPTQTPPPAPPPSADTGAVIVSRSAPPFPVEGIRQGIKLGFVKARLTIDARGNVSDVGILESRPIAAFGRETRTTLKDWKFNPGAAGRTYDIEITFKP